MRIVGMRIAAMVLAICAGFAAPAQTVSDDRAPLKLLFIGTDPAKGAPGPLPEDLPFLHLDGLPASDQAKQEVFAAQLRTNPVSTFVTTLDTAEKNFDQLYLVSAIDLVPGENTLSLRIGDQALEIEDFSTRVQAVVDAFDPKHRRIAFLTIEDATESLPLAVSELQTAFNGIGFDMLVILVNSGKNAACTSDALPALHYSIMTGLADTTPFGDGDGTSQVGEVEAFLRAALSRQVARKSECAPSYSMILKASADPNVPLVTTSSQVAFADQTSALHNESFEALFLLGSDDKAALEQFLEACIYCPNESDLEERLRAMNAYELTSKLESQIWERVKDDQTDTRLKIYLENCKLCVYRDDVSAAILRISQIEAATEAEKNTFEAARQNRDLTSLEAYVASCIACEFKQEAQAAIAEIQADVVYQHDVALRNEALASGTLDALKNYLANCSLCSDRDLVEARYAEARTRQAAQQPCLELAGLPQMRGPRRIEDIDVTKARAACDAFAASYPDDGLVRTILGRISQAEGNMSAAESAYAYGVDADVPAAYGFTAYLHYAPTDGAEPDLYKAEQLASEGAARGDWLSKEILSVLYSRNLIDGKTSQDAVALAREIASQGNELGAFLLGSYYLTGNGIEQNDVEAATWLTKAVQGGYRNADTYLAELFEAGRGVEKDTAKAADLLWDAMLVGNELAYTRLTDDLSSRDTEVVLRIQQRLVDEGIYRGRVDGRAGAGTRRAIETYYTNVVESSVIN